jgi:hypothetical protein
MEGVYIFYLLKGVGIGENINVSNRVRRILLEILKI